MIVEEEEEEESGREVPAQEAITAEEEVDMREEAVVLAMGTDEKSAQRPMVMGGLL